MMFRALMGKFQLQLFIFIAYFSIVVPLNSCIFLPVGLLSLTRNFKQVLNFFLSSVNCQLPKPGDRRNYKIY